MFRVQVQSTPHDRITIRTPQPREQPRSFMLRVTALERAFLLHTLSDTRRITDAILAHPDIGGTASPWSRETIRSRLMTLIAALNTGESIYLGRTLEQRLIVEAFVSSRYFADTRESDPRGNELPYRRIDALRERLARTFGRPIARVPLGKGSGRMSWT